MKRNKILTYAFLMAFPMTVGSIFSSCTDDFEKLNTSNIQVNPADLPFAAQCTEPMTYCYPPQQNMFQFWTNLTIDLYGGYFMTPNGNFTNGDMGENRGHSGGMYENYYLHIFNNTRRIIAQCDASGERGLSGVMRANRRRSAQPSDETEQHQGGGARPAGRVRDGTAARSVRGPTKEQRCWTSFFRRSRSLTYSTSACFSRSRSATRISSTTCSWC